jgi:hypothetical protein
MANAQSSRQLIVGGGIESRLAEFQWLRSMTTRTHNGKSEMRGFFASLRMTNENGYDVICGTNPTDDDQTVMNGRPRFTRIGGGG